MLQPDWKTLIGVLVFVATGAAGDLLLSFGMRQLGPFPGFHPAGLFRFMQHIVTTPAVLAGTALLAAGFGTFLALLTWEHLSVVVPARAGSYLFTTLLAHYLLGEAVPLQRWLGVVVITIGITLVLASSQSSERSVSTAVTQDVTLAAPRTESVWTKSAWASAGCEPTMPTSPGEARPGSEVAPRPAPRPRVSRSASGLRETLSTHSEAVPSAQRAPGLG